MGLLFFCSEIFVEKPAGFSDFIFCPPRTAHKRRCGAALLSFCSGIFVEKPAGFSDFIFCPPRTAHKRCSRDTSCGSPAPKEEPSQATWFPFWIFSPAACRRKWGLDDRSGASKECSLMKRVQSASFHNGRAESVRYSVDIKQRTPTVLV